MANQSKLKAWVRYDGTNTVVTAGPIFRAAKPKVGNWRQINADLCCNSSTTTTTTGGGGVTPTAFVKGYWTSATSSCLNTTEGTQVFYSASSTLAPGSFVFQDAALTIPVTVGWVINVDPFIYPRLIVGAGGALTQVYCLDNFYFGTTAEIACSQSSPAELLNVAANTPSVNIGTIIYTFFNSGGFSIGQTVYMRFSPGFAATVSVLITSETTGTVTGTTTACPPPVFEQSGFAAFSAGVVCAGGGTPTTVYYSGSLGIGTTLWLDAGLTNAYQAGVNGGYLRLYFAAQDNQCIISGAGQNEIISYTAC